MVQQDEEKLPAPPYYVLRSGETTSTLRLALDTMRGVLELARILLSNWKRNSCFSGF